ncbi:MAG TPA: hypothetical protein VLG36_00970 [Candidatus Chromulinivoraceae bacterium]|nr:hypothetical protein [Candidatus Chromulinivoraceae bacterium]
MSWIKSFFGSQQKTVSMVSASPIDVVVYLASLASNPQSIDPILDPLRNITSRLGPERILSEQDQVLLAGVYIKLVQHLITNEPAQIFTKEGLEARVRATFTSEKVANKVFWDELAKI